MKKKLMAMIIAAMMAGLTACGSGSSTSTQETSSTSTQSTITTEAATESDSQTGNPAAESVGTEAASQKANLDFDGSSQSDTGDGKFYLVTASGSTKDGSPVILYAGNNDILIQIEFDTEGINGGSLSYVYIDGMEKDKEQVSDSQVSLDLSEDDLSVGKHKVELVQFENDDPTGTVTTYKSAEYEVREK